MSFNYEIFRFPQSSIAPEKVVPPSIFSMPAVPLVPSLVFDTDIFKIPSCNKEQEVTVGRSLFSIGKLTDGQVESFFAADPTLSAPNAVERKSFEESESSPSKGSKWSIYDETLDSDSSVPFSDDEMEGLEDDPTFRPASPLYQLPSFPKRQPMAETTLQERFSVEYAFHCDISCLNRGFMKTFHESRSIAGYSYPEIVAFAMIAESGDRHDAVLLFPETTFYSLMDLSAHLPGFFPFFSLEVRHHQGRAVDVVYVRVVGSVDFRVYEARPESMKLHYPKEAFHQKELQGSTLVMKIEPCNPEVRPSLMRDLKRRLKMLSLPPDEFIASESRESGYAPLRPSNVEIPQDHADIDELRTLVTLPEILGTFGELKEELLGTEYAEYPVLGDEMKGIKNFKLRIDQEIVKKHCEFDVDAFSAEVHLDKVQNLSFDSFHFAVKGSHTLNHRLSERGKLCVTLDNPLERVPVHTVKHRYLGYLKGVLGEFKVFVLRADGDFKHQSIRENLMRRFLTQSAKRYPKKALEGNICQEFEGSQTTYVEFQFPVFRDAMCSFLADQPNTKEFLVITSYDNKKTASCQAVSIEEFKCKVLQFVSQTFKDIPNMIIDVGVRVSSPDEGKTIFPTKEATESILDGLVGRTDEFVTFSLNDLKCWSWKRHIKNDQVSPFVAVKLYSESAEWLNNGPMRRNYFSQFSSRIPDRRTKYEKLKYFRYKNEEITKSRAKDKNLLSTLKYYSGTIANEWVYRIEFSSTLDGLGTTLLAAENLSKRSLPFFVIQTEHIVNWIHSMLATFYYYLIAKVPDFRAKSEASQRFYLIILKFLKIRFVNDSLELSRIAKFLEEELLVKVAGEECGIHWLHMTDQLDWSRCLLTANIDDVMLVNATVYRDTGRGLCVERRIEIAVYLYCLDIVQRRRVLDDQLLQCLVDCCTAVYFTLVTQSGYVREGSLYYTGGPFSIRPPKHAKARFEMNVACFGPHIKVSFTRYLKGARIEDHHHAQSSSLLMVDWVRRVFDPTKGHKAWLGKISKDIGSEFPPGWAHKLLFAEIAKICEISAENLMEALVDFILKTKPYEDVPVITDTSLFPLTGAHIWKKANYLSELPKHLIAASKLIPRLNIEGKTLDEAEIHEENEGKYQEPGVKLSSLRKVWIPYSREKLKSLTANEKEVLSICRGKHSNHAKGYAQSLRKCWIVQPKSRGKFSDFEWLLLTLCLVKDYKADATSISEDIGAGFLRVIEQSQKKSILEPVRSHRTLVKKLHYLKNDGRFFLQRCIWYLSSADNLEKVYKERERVMTNQGTVYSREAAKYLHL